MKKCVRCGRLGLFYFLDKDGLCEKCAKEEELRWAEQARVFALEQVKKASAAFRDIAENGGHLPKYSSISWLETSDVPAGQVAQLREDCALICAVLKGWDSTPFFIEAVHEVSNLEEDGICFQHPDMDFGLRLRRTSTWEDLRQRIPQLIEKVELLDQALERYGPYECRSYRVVGTSFKNDDGTSRQSILWDLDHRVSPFRDKVELRLEKYKYEEEDAIKVYANNQQIGHISRNDAQFFVLPRWDRYAGVSGYTILGGGHLKYGISVEVMFRKER